MSFTEGLMEIARTRKVTPLTQEQLDTLEKTIREQKKSLIFKEGYSTSGIIESVQGKS